MKTKFLQLKNNIGSTLPLVLAILIIISTLMTIYFVELNQLNRVLANEIVFEKAKLNMESGFNFADALPTLETISDSMLVTESDLRFSIRRYQIGIGSVNDVQGRYGQEQVSKIKLKKIKVPKFNTTALITQTRLFQNPLYLAGNTKINGDIITGKYGALTKRLRNLPYKPKENLSGVVRRMSNVQFPMFKREKLDRLLELNHETRFNEGKILQLDYKVVRSHSEDLQRIIGPGTVLLDAWPDSLKEITNANVIIDGDVQLNSQETYIRNSFIYSKDAMTITGIFKDNQFASSERIELLANAQMLGTNLMLVIGDKSHIKLRYPRIIISESAIVDAHLVYLEDSQMDPRSGYIPFKLLNSRPINGSVYSPFGIYSNVRVNGPMFVNYFEYVLNGSRYQNWAVDLEVKANPELKYFDMFEF